MNYSKRAASRLRMEFPVGHYPPGSDIEGQHSPA